MSLDCTCFCVWMWMKYMNIHKDYRFCSISIWSLIHECSFSQQCWFTNNFLMSKHPFCDNFVKKADKIRFVTVINCQKQISYDVIFIVSWFINLVYFDKDKLWFANYPTLHATWFSFCTFSHKINLSMLCFFKVLELSDYTFLSFFLFSTSSMTSYF